jgi:hypothetical protein
MEYKGIRYTIRTRIVRNEWCVAIHSADSEVANKVIIGPRSTAEEAAHAMIDAWLRLGSRKKLHSAKI